MLAVPVRPGPRFGDTSVLLLRDRRPVLGSCPAGADVCVRCGGRAGDVSREESGELAVEGEPEAFRLRAPLIAWCRMEEGAVLSDAEAAGGRARFVESYVEAIEAGGVGVDVEESGWGSAVSRLPDTERKEVS